MTRYWVSWYSGNYEDEGCTAPPFTFWVSGQCERPNYGLSEEEYATWEAIEDGDESDEYLNTHARDTCTICALIDAPSEEEIWKVVAKHFPDYEYRFCEERATDYTVGDRFRHDGEIKTSLQ